MIKKFVLLFSVTLFTTGCLHTAMPRATTIGSDNNKTYGTHMFIGKCVNNIEFVDRPEFLGLGTEVVAGIASSLIGAGIDALGNALTNAAADDVRKTVVTSNVQGIASLYPKVRDQNANPIMTCIQIVRGIILPLDNRKESSFTKFDSIPSPLAPFEFSNSIDGKSYDPIYVSKASYELSDMELFVEILPVFKDGAVSFVPLELKYNGLSSGESGAKKARDLALTIGFVLPNTELSETNLSGRSINFGTVTANTGKLVNIRYVTEGGKVSTLMQSQWMPVNNNMKSQPLTVSAYIHESRKAGEFVKLLSTAFADSKDDIKTKLQTEAKEAIAKKDASEEELEKAKIAKQVEKLTAQTTILVLEEELITECSKEELPSASSITLKEIKIYELKKLFNISYPDDQYEDVKEPTKSCDDWQ